MMSVMTREIESLESLGTRKYLHDTALDDQARLVVCSHALDADDARLLLQMLGLIPS